MKKISTLFCLLCIILLLLSCSSHREFSFARSDSLKSLEGTYINREDYMTRAFNIYRENIDLVRIDFPTADTLHLSCLTDTGFTSTVYKGQFKPRKGYFEIIFDKKKTFFLLLNRVSNDKVRIGRDTSGKLLLNKEDDIWGNLLIFMGGYSYDFGESMEAINDSTLIPVQKDGKWGFSDTQGNIMITPAYDFVRIFDGDVACVRVDGKWGLINRQGMEVIPAKYKKIEPFNGNETTWVYSDYKVGCIDRQGAEVIPVIYDRIGYINDSINYSLLEGKYGFVSRTQVIYPPLFDAYFVGNGKDMAKKIPHYLSEVVIGGVSYIADKDGYIYNVSTNMWGTQKIDYNSKRHWEGEGFILKSKVEEQQNFHQYTE